MQTGRGHRTSRVALPPEQLLYATTVKSPPPPPARALPVRMSRSTPLRELVEAWHRCEEARKARYPNLPRGRPALRR